ncbi:hypothetical protein HanXRQr2_Chr16g0769021 [Helianthus annuus]|uniref:Uncharacterized protein n=1 Tax=Helianthus annuus TaxID=4232 RepID=A0A9K3DUB1_HELAN|nr:hypothetical protein HanXRQr2_Chr16g0769021 [Helianthus annuus]KAJ0444698.1 hypothetical protein HanIR_Chr16g0834701 [Helianthus annuus]KAJ0822865.1 hypothetical protein HanPSC8_Chr16g0737041 [Helianthus annuus]
MLLRQTKVVSMSDDSLPPLTVVTNCQTWLDLIIYSFSTARGAFTEEDITTRCHVTYPATTGRNQGCSIIGDPCNTHTFLSLSLSSAINTNLSLSSSTHPNLPGGGVPDRVGGTR